jgi:uncharacterized protein YutE (UPF0331/DUF86 family)/predicted nucleotidyltransferase
MDKDVIIEKLGDYFKGRKDVVFAYLFGSVAKDQAHSESDVDIGVYFRPDSKTLEYESENRYPGESDIGSDLERLVGRQTDVVVLNRAPSTLFSAVLSEGNQIFSADENLLSRLSGAVNDLAEDFRDFIFDFVKIKERSRSLSPNDRVRLERAADFIRDQMTDFKNFAQVDQRQYERDVSLRRNLERWAETLANASIDVAKILIASKKRPIPQTYKSILKELAFLDGFDENVASKLARFSDMRNVLAHEYLDLRFALVGQFVKEGEPIFEYLLKYAQETIHEGATKQ